MEIIVKGAFKFASAQGCASALHEYESGGYGVLAVSDWKVAGSYAFIDAPLELDADMVSWRESFEELARSAREGEVDLREEGAGVFHRIVAKEKRKLAVTEEASGFGEPYAARLVAWGAAVAKVQKAEAKKKAAKEKARAEARALAQTLCTATVELGRAGYVLFAEGDGSVSVIAGAAYARVSPSGIVERYELPVGAGVDSLVRLDDDTLVAWSEWSPSVQLLRDGGVRTIALSPSETNAQPAPCDVLAAWPGELVIAERQSIRVVDLEGRQTRALPFTEVPSHVVNVAQWPHRTAAVHRPQGVVLDGAVAFPIRSEHGSAVLVITEHGEHRIELQGKALHTLASVRGAPFVCVKDERSGKVSIHPLSKEGLGSAPFEVELYEPRARPIDAERWVVCGGFESVHAGPSGASLLRHGSGFVPHVADVRADGAVAITSRGGNGRVDMVRDARLLGSVDARFMLAGARWVDDELVGWTGESPSLYLLRAGAPVRHLLGHEHKVTRVAALGGTAFASLDTGGVLHFWDLARELS